jgi:AcrR family transcriptional regulator
MSVERSGGGDPDRTVALLWRARAAHGQHDGKPARGRRPTLTVDQIVAAAIAVADREGLSSMSMVRVAEELGVGTMSLYTYVPGKAELIDLMVDAVMMQRALPGPGDDRPTGWRAQVELYAERTRDAHRRHPWLRQVSTVRPPLGPGLLGQYEYLLSALAGSALPTRQMDAAMGAIITFVDAAAAMEAENEHTERATGQSFDAWWAARESFWHDYFDADEYPTLTRVWNHGGFSQRATDAAIDAYEFGLQRLLDGIQSTIETGRG